MLKCIGLCGCIGKENEYQIHLFNICPMPYEFAVRIEEAVTSLEDDAKRQLKSTVSKLRTSRNMLKFLLKQLPQ
jgi:hypothetical protein